MPMIRCNVSYFPNFLNHACVYVCAHALSLMCERVGSNFLTYKIFSRAVVCSANSLRVPNAERLFKSCNVHMGPPRRLDFRATSRIMADVFLSPSNFASICLQYLIYFHLEFNFFHLRNFSSVKIHSLSRKTRPGSLPHSRTPIDVK